MWKKYTRQSWCSWWIGSSPVPGSKYHLWAILAACWGAVRSQLRYLVQETPPCSSTPKLHRNAVLAPPATCCCSRRSRRLCSHFWVLSTACVIRATLIDLQTVGATPCMQKTVLGVTVGERDHLNLFWIVVPNVWGLWTGVPVGWEGVTSLLREQNNQISEQLEPVTQLDKNTNTGPVTFTDISSYSIEQRKSEKINCWCCWQSCWRCTSKWGSNGTGPPRCAWSARSLWCPVTSTPLPVDTMTNKLCLMEPKLTNLDRAGQS